jgi:acetate kinase
VRERSLSGLEPLGIALDPVRNRAPGATARMISAEDSAVSVLVVPTDEELEMARQAVTVLDRR